jgi:ATP-dependent Lon protease
MNEQKTNFLPLLPLKNVVILPKSIMPVIVGRAPSIEAVEYAFKEGRSLFITAQKQSHIESPSADDLFTYGTRSTILQVMRMPKGALKILVEGICRSKALSIEEHQGFLAAHCVDLETTNLERTVEIEALWRHLQSLYTLYSQLETKAPADLMHNVRTAEDMDFIGDTLLAHINLPFTERQEFLETIDLHERLSKLINIFKKEIAILETEERIRGRVQHQVEKNQREYYLTEQIKAIHKELGREDRAAEISQLQTQIKALNLPAEPLEKVQKELNRLEQMAPMSSEAVVSKHYIDWIMALPWHKATTDSISLAEAEDILNQQHAGLTKVKERIIEFLAAKKFSSKLERSPIICLVGPPGVGKTSLATSIADSLGRKFVRISLGGVRDEAEIRGHRRTYIGALPGKILQAMRKAKTVNPVILLDEIDKLSSDHHGDPASALLEVLDPEQNKTFVDHFVELEYDLSKVMFITTANHLEGIPYPLFDRMEIIQISGYTEEEKMEIANNFLVPKNLKQYGLRSSQFKLDTDTLRIVINSYTKEAGVRQLERIIAKLMRKTIQLLLKDPETKKVVITPDLLKKWLGAARYKPTSLDKTEGRIGLATGLAWTELGGDVLEIEATVIPGKGNITLTGQLGEVMQESAYAALTYIKSRAAQLGLAPNFNTNKDIHIHIPEGATPKDGPSAGITLCTALVSALTKNPTIPTIAMTGEITLRGRVFPIGGLKEKILAAQHHGISTIIVPKEVEDELEEIKTEINTEGLTFICVSTMDEVLKIALVNDPFLAGETKKKNGAKKTAAKRKQLKKATKTKK